MLVLVKGQPPWASTGLDLVQATIQMRRPLNLHPQVMKDHVFPLYHLQLTKKEIKKSLTKIGLKKIPLVGLAVSGFSAYMLQKEGDTTGAALEVASGVAGTVPGVGTALSIAADVAQVSRYAYKSAYGVFPEDDEPGQRGERLKEIKDVVEKLIIGSNEEADKVNAEKVKGERDSGSVVAWGKLDRKSTRLNSSHRL